MNTARRLLIPAAIAIVAVLVLFAPRFAQGLDEAELLNSEAVELFGTGRVQEALEKLKVAQSQKPDDPIILSNLGYVYQTLGRYSDCRKVLKNAISIDPMNADAHNVLGICNYYLGDMEAAVSEWEWIARVNPQNEAAKMNLALARGEAELGAPVEPKSPTYVSTPDTKPRSQYTAEELFYDAKKAYNAGDYQRVVDNLLDVLEVKPNSILSHYYLGLAYGYLANPEGAKSHLREFLIQESYPPESPEAYKRARSVFNQLNKTGKMPARGASSDADAGQRFAAGKKAYREKDFFRAIHYLKEAVGLKPDSFPSNFYLGLSYGAVGDKERAVFHLSKCLVLMDSSQADYKKNKVLIQQAIEKVIRK